MKDGLACIATMPEGDDLEWAIANGYVAVVSESADSCHTTMTQLGPLGAE